MTFQVALGQLIDVLSATPLHISENLHQNIAFGINTDTRTVQPGELFLALRGESFDGHRFVEPAIAAGAIVATNIFPARGWKLLFLLLTSKLIRLSTHPTHPIAPAHFRQCYL